MRFEHCKHESFCNRFVSDFKVPIELPVNSENFEKYLLSWDTTVYRYYVLTCNFINAEYNGNIEEYLKDYYKIREILITSIKDNEYFKEITNIKDYSAKEYIEPCDEMKNKLHRDLYNRENINKFFFSFDIRNANFTALKFAEPKIFSNYTKYEDWLNDVLKDFHPYWVDYFIRSKYTRQVIFGQANPKFVMSVEKNIITQICNKFFEICSSEIKNNIFVDIFNSDEVVFGIKNADSFYNDDFRCKLEMYIHEATNEIIKDSNVKFYDDFHRDWFILNGYSLYNENQNKEIQVFYVKSSDNEYHTLQKRYKLYVRESFHNFDYGVKNIPDIFTEFTIDGITYKMQDKIIIKQINY